MSHAVTLNKHDQVQQHVTNVTGLEIRAGDDLPQGVCGRVRGVALVYDTVDTYDTMFARGCLTRTASERVPIGKVKLFADHGPFTHTHVGVVRKLYDDGDRAVMEADLFDTEAGRSMKEYLAAVVASGASTGLSVGFKQRSGEWVTRGAGQPKAWRFTEIALSEVSITPANSVPGTDVLSVRAEGQPRKFDGKFGIEDLGADVGKAKASTGNVANSVVSPDVDPVTGALTSALKNALLSDEEIGAILPILGDAYKDADNNMGVYDAVAQQNGRVAGSLDFLKPTLAAAALQEKLSALVEDTTFIPIFEKLGLNFDKANSVDLMTHPIGPNAVYEAARSMAPKKEEPMDDEHDAKMNSECSTDEQEQPANDEERAAQDTPKFVSMEERIAAVRKSLSPQFISTSQET